MTGRDLPGRGAWLCLASPACLARAEKRGAFSRALRAPVDSGAVVRLRTALVDPAPPESGEPEGPAGEGPVDPPG